MSELTFRVLHTKKIFEALSEELWEENCFYFPRGWHSLKFTHTGPNSAQRKELPNYITTIISHSITAVLMSLNGPDQLHLVPLPTPVGLGALFKLQPRIMAAWFNYGGVLFFSSVIVFYAYRAIECWFQFGGWLLSLLLVMPCYYKPTWKSLDLVLMLAWWLVS